MSNRNITPHTGFTLAELLISLAILGLIATFTIPKIMSAQQNNEYSAIAQEDIATLSAALHALLRKFRPNWFGEFGVG